MKKSKSLTNRGKKKKLLDDDGGEEEAQKANSVGSLDNLNNTEGNDVVLSPKTLKQKLLGGGDKKKDKTKKKSNKDKAGAADVDLPDDSIPASSGSPKKKKKGLFGGLGFGKRNNSSPDKHGDEQPLLGQESAPAEEEAHDIEDELQDSQVQIEEGPPIGEIMATQSDDEVSAIQEVITDNVVTQETLEGEEVIFNPEEFDICFGDRHHPGTKEFIAVVRDCLEKFEGQDYAPPIYKAVKKRLKGRRFLIRIDENELTSWREATKPENIELIGECFEEERGRAAGPSSHSRSHASSIESMQSSAKQSDESLSVGDLASPPAQAQQAEKKASPPANGGSNGKKTARSMSKKSSQILSNALAECASAKEYAEPYDDIATMHKGIAAEQKLAMLQNLASAPNTMELKTELDKLDDLAKRMRYSSMAPLLGTLERIEKSITEYFQTMAQEASISSLKYSQRQAAHVSQEEDGPMDDVEEKAVHSARSIPVDKTPSSTMHKTAVVDDGSIESSHEYHDASQHLEASEHSEQLQEETEAQEETEVEEEIIEEVVEDSERQEESEVVEETEADVSSSGFHSEGSQSLHEGDGGPKGLSGLADMQGSSLALEDAHLLELPENNDDFSSVGASMREYDFGDLSSGEFEEVEESEVYEDDEEEGSDDNSSGSSSSSDSDSNKEPAAVEKEEPVVEEPVNPKTEAFFDRLLHFHEVRRKVEDRVDIFDPSHKLANLKVKQHSGGIQKKSGKFKKEYQQHNLQDEVAKNLDDLYEAAAQAQPEFKRVMTGMLKNVKGFVETDFKLAALKPRDRAYHKAKEEYSDRKPGPPECWLYDVVRGSVICKSFKQIKEVNSWLGKHCHIVKGKNRFAWPCFNGYHDFLYHISIPFGDGLAHICELQVHHKDLKSLDVQFGLPTHYETFRSSFAGGWREEDAIISDLEMLSEYGDIGGTVMKTMMRSKDPDQLRLFASICRLHLDEYEKALQLYRKVLMMQEDTYGKNHEDVAQTYLNIGLVLGAQGQTEDCLMHLQKALAIQESVLGKDHLTVAESHEEIGNMLCKKGDYVGALDQFKACMKIRKAKLPKDHYLVIDSHRDIARALEGNGDFKKAVKELNTALDTQKALLGEQHVDVAKTLTLIGNVLCAYGDYEQSMTMHKNALAIREEALGKNHILTAESHSAIGMVLAQRGDYETSEWHHRKALKMVEVMRGKEHEDAAYNYTHIGNVLLKKGDLDGALTEFSRAHDIRANTLGQDHSLTASTFVDLGNVECAKENYLEAFAEYRRANLINESSLGSHHPDTATTYLAIGRVVNLKGSFKEALDQHKRALDILEKVYGKNHPVTARGYELKADALMAKGDLDDALIEHRRALAIRANLFAKDHPDTASSCTSVGSILLVKGDFVGAMVAFRQALAITSSLCGADHPNTASAHVNVGKVFVGQEDLTEAMNEFKQAASIRETALGVDSIQFAETSKLIGSVLSIQGDFQGAEEKHEAAYEIYKSKLGEDHALTQAAKKKLELAQKFELEEKL